MMLLLYVERAVVVLLAAVALLLAIVSFRQASPDQQLPVFCSAADSGSGAFLTPGSGRGKKSVSGSGKNIPDHISESLETIFWAKDRSHLDLVFKEEELSGMRSNFLFIMNFFSQYRF
jgi:hypothetical protein